MCKTLSLLLACLLLSAPVLAAESAPVVAVFNIENRGSPLSPEYIAALTDFLATKLGEGGTFRIVPRDKLRDRLRKEQKASHQSCYDQSCQIEIGRELAAGYTVSTAIARMGNTCLITAAMYDLHKAATYRTATGKATCQVDPLLGELETVADKLLGKAPAPKPTPAASSDPPVGRAQSSPPAAPPLAKKKEPPSNLLALQTLVVNFNHLSGEWIEQINQSGIASGITYDLRLSDLFTLGGGVRIYSDIGLLNAVLRGGLLFRLSRSWLLTTQLEAGYAYAWELLLDDAFQSLTSHGFTLHGGASIQWLLFDWLGITLDLVVGTLYSSASDSDKDTWQFQANFGFGVVFAW